MNFYRLVAQLIAGGWLALTLTALPAFAGEMSCPFGKVVVPGSGGQCCWLQQRWEGSACVGEPSCPYTMELSGGTCKQRAIPIGAPRFPLFLDFFPQANEEPTLVEVGVQVVDMRTSTDEKRDRIGTFRNTYGAPFQVVVPKFQVVTTVISAYVADMLRAVGYRATSRTLSTGPNVTVILNELDCDGYMIYGFQFGIELQSGDWSAETRVEIRSSPVPPPDPNYLYFPRAFMEASRKLIPALNSSGFAATVGGPEAGGTWEAAGAPQGEWEKSYRRMHKRRQREARAQHRRSR